MFKSINWGTIIVTALITGLVTIVTGLVVNGIINMTPNLTYSYRDTIPFQGTEKVLGIYSVRVYNASNKVVEDVSCTVEIKNANIEQVKIISDKTIKINSSFSGNKSSINLQYLNSNEYFDINILASSKDDLPNSPEISLRAKGVVGKQEIKTNDNIITIMMVISAVISILSVALMLLLRRTINRDKYNKKHSDDQKSILGYLCNCVGLKTNSDYFYHLETDTSYWAESDKLCIAAINSNDTDTINKTIDLFEHLLDYANIADGSKGIIHFNKAKLYVKINKQSEAKSEIELAKKLRKGVIELRLKYDPVFIGVQF